MPFGGGTVIGELTGVTIQGIWTSEDIWSPHSGNRFGIENFESDTANTLADYDEVDADATCSADNTTFTMVGINPPPNGDYVRKIIAVFTNATTNMCGQTITLVAAQDWSGKDKLYLQVYGDGNSNKLYIQLNQGGSWGAQTEVDTIDWTGWQEVSYTFTETRTDIRGLRILIKQTAGNGTYTYYIDLIQVAETTRASEWEDLVFTYTMPANTTITVTFYDELTDTLLKTVDLSGSSPETLTLSSYSELLDKDIYLKFILESADYPTANPTITSLVASWRQDGLGDWSLRRTIASYTAS